MNFLPNSKKADQTPTQKSKKTKPFFIDRYKTFFITTPKSKFPSPSSLNFFLLINLPSNFFSPSSFRFSA
ncbi:unnamed protein product [Citrullus colocynthis]|uniref:Uncharacterized protein n=1 Tax=Citrullus colocynthis TaxID=252529 RepID=A0ABP0YTZ4_9ROSI